MATLISSFDNSFDMYETPRPSWSGIVVPPNSPSRGSSPVPRHHKRPPEDDLDEVIPTTFRSKRRRNSLGWEPKLASLAIDVDPSPAPTDDNNFVNTQVNESPIYSSMDEDSSTSEDEKSEALTFHPTLVQRLNRLIKPKLDSGLQLSLNSIRPREDRALVLYKPILPPSVSFRSSSPDPPDESPFAKVGLESNVVKREEAVGVKPGVAQAEGDVDMMDIDP